MLAFYDSQIEKINSQIKTAFDKSFSFSLLPPWLSQFVQLAIHNSLCKRFSGSQLSNRLFGKKKADLVFTSGKTLLKHKRMNIFFCIFLGQVKRDEQIIVISNNSNGKWKTKLILYKQQQIWDHSKIFLFFQLRKISVKKLVGKLFCFDCMITRKFYFWNGTNAI